MQMKRGHEAAGMPHSAACRRRIERAMGDVGDQRVTTAEERITEFIAEQIADSVSRTHTAVSSKLRRSPVVISRVCGAKTTETIRILHRR